MATVDLQAPFAALTDPQGRDHIVDRRKSTLAPFRAECGRVIQKSSAYFTARLSEPACPTCLHAYRQAIAGSAHV